MAKALPPTSSHSWRRTILPALIIAGLSWHLPVTPAVAQNAPKLAVAASIVPLGDFCRQIGGELVQVQVLIPPGASPHAFEPPPSVMVRAAGARVLVYIGAGLEPWADKLRRSWGSRDVAVVEAARGMDLLRDVDHHHHVEPESPQEKAGHAQKAGKPERGEESHSHAAGNPHIWLDPVLAQDICRKIAAAFIQADPGHRAVYEANLENYLKELAVLDQEIRERVKTWRLREYVSFHPAYTYFARRYGLEEVGVMELAPGREPTPRHLQKVIKAIKHYGIKVVFAEPQLNPRVAEVVAQEAGVKVLMLDPVGGRPPYGTDYLQMMRHNLATLEAAMK